ncbi:unnamed protein product [marine sediment metagenome]|uniref:Polymerase/histidinol phosphatase N-terminal domain-containing protein n=1 Tax=marine sediment metagenome TaxID=412755 RepID=X1D0S2_9ZZZZ
MSVSFVHLKCHTEYSIVDSLVRIDALMASCQAAHMPAMAITDYGNLFGLVKFYRKALKAGIKPIIGADVTLVDDGEQSLVTLLVQNQQGYQHLTELLSQGYTEGQTPEGQPTITWSWFFPY